MHIDRIELTNFRCFEQLTFDLAERVTLLIGPNGAGKTALLAAIRVALAQWPIAFDPTPDRDTGRGVEPTDIRRVTVSDAPERVLPLTVRVLGQHAQSPWQVEASSSDGKELIFDGNLIDHARAARAAIAAPHSAPTVRLPLFAVIGARVGLRQDPPEEDDAWLASRASAYHHSLIGGLRMPALVRWLKWREDALTQDLGERLEALGDTAAERLLTGDYPDFATAVRAIVGVERPPELEAISAAGCAVLPGARAVRYHYASGTLRVRFDDGHVLPLDLLSDGMRRILSIAMRLAWMAVRLNPQDAADAPRLATGVVLIDEVELHLHPRWQREILPRLTAAFPGLQFIATTHSPQVVSTAQPEWMRLITTDGVHRVGKVHGRDSNTLLQQAFATPERPTWMEEKLSRLEGAIEAGHLKQARTLLDEVRGDLGADDATVANLAWELSDAEDHGAMD